jgi:hypothetical protein
LTPLGIRYEDSYVKAYPFDRLVGGMLDPEMVRETGEIVKTAIEKGMMVYLIINNPAVGNAPLIAKEIAKKFMAKKEPEVSSQLSYWDR